MHITQSLSIYQKSGLQLTASQSFLALFQCDYPFYTNRQQLPTVFVSAATASDLNCVDIHLESNELNNIISGVITLEEGQISVMIMPDTQQVNVSFILLGADDKIRHFVDRLSHSFRAGRHEYIEACADEDSKADERVVARNLSEFPLIPGRNHPDWVYEYDNAGERHHFKIKEVIAAGETSFQSYAILDTYAYGKVLFLDGFVQSAQKDEHIYHESLIQPAMLSHAQPKSVLVIGAGEGASAREILYHPSVERVVLIDLDEELIQLCKSHLYTHHRGAFDHPKVELRFEDGYKYLKNTDEKFDIIVIDVVDAIEEGPAQALYTQEFYTFLKTHNLNPGGIVVVQSMELNDVDLNDDWHVHRELSLSFEHVCSYAAFVPSFWSKWRFTIASDALDFDQIAAAEIDEAIRNRAIEHRLNYMSGEVFESLRGLSKQARLTQRIALANAGKIQAEADISKHFQDWELGAYLESTRGKNLD
ncbi:MAG: methyltransferase domain-containing protein [Gammaproteobacteria bacterium]|nr:methyltransferase domain-containing protein [Gammaproteobacteria bacterium]